MRVHRIRMLSWYVKTTTINIHFKLCITNYKTIDRKTPATKKDDSCGCESSFFGCCPDGRTEAKGEEFEGCGEVPIKPGGAEKYFHSRS